MGGAAKAICIFALLATSQTSLAEENADPSMACFASIESKPELKSIKSKVALSDVRKQNIEMLANDKKPTKSEKAAISSWVTLVEQCVAEGSRWRQQNTQPQVNSLFVQYFSDLKSLSADLYSGKISYGKFAKERAAAGAKLIADITDINQKALVQRKAQDDELRAQQEKREQQAREDQRRQQEFAAQQQQQQEIMKQQRLAQQRQAALQQQQLQQQQQAQYQQQMQQNYQQQMQSNDEWLRNTQRALSPSTTNTDCYRDAQGGIHCTTR